MVTREAIRRIRRNVFRRTQQLIIDKKGGCDLLEHAWHVLFRGEARFTGKTIGELVHSTPSAPAPSY